VDEKIRHTDLWNSLFPDLIGIQVGDRVAFINTAGARMLGAANAEQLVGKAITDFVHPDYHETIIELFRKAHRGETQVSPSEEKWIRLDGTVIDVKVVATPITYQDQQAMQFIVCDVTRREQAE
jgi:PAS domain S-box-containing protein